MANLECASLVLKTSYLALGGTNSIGISNNNISSMTWTNIDLRTVLGDMYNRYDLFNLCLTNVASDAVGTAFGIGHYLNGITDNALVIFYVGGLPWKNQTYCQESNRNNSLVPIATFQFPTAQNLFASQNYNNPKFITFGKSQDTVNFSIQYRRVADDIPVASADPYPEMIFMFSIYGIPRDHGNENGNRIIL